MKKFNCLAVAIVLIINLQIVIGQNNITQQTTRVDYVCDSGYYWSGQACLQCQSVTDGICSCTSYGGCNQVTCNQNFYNFGNLTNPNCLQILSNSAQDECMTTSYSQNSVICTQCQQGYLLIGQICIKPKGCSIISNLTLQCLQCQTGYYMVNTDESSYSCDECMTGCSSCGSKYTCQQCLSTYTWNIATQQCQMKCNIQNCDTCSSSYQNCSICSSLYYLNTNMTCSLCSIEGCNSCQSSSICASCNSGYYLNSISQCESCGSGCLTCSNSTNCLACTSTSILSNGTCLTCPSNCQSGYCSLYNGSAICTQCQDLFTRNSNTSCQLCQANNTNWTRCAGPMDSSYYNETQPTQCKNNMATSNVNGTNQCIQDSSNCLSYGNTSQTCLTCYSGYYLVGTNCYSCSNKFSGCVSCMVNTSQTTQFSCSQCSQGYYLNSGTCSQCPSSCQVCTQGTQCSICMSGYYLSNSNSSCIQCSVSDCSSCSTSGICSTCMSGSFLNNNSCMSCPQDCATCNYPGQTCQSCYSGYVLMNGGCVQNNQGTGCLLQSQNTPFCLVCDYNYYILNGQCQKCVYDGFICRNNNGILTLQTSSDTPSNSTENTTTSSSFAQNLIPIAAIVLLLIL